MDFYSPLFFLLFFPFSLTIFYWFGMQWKHQKKILGIFFVFSFMWVLWNYSVDIWKLLVFVVIALIHRYIVLRNYPWRRYWFWFAILLTTSLFFGFSRFFSYSSFGMGVSTLLLLSYLIDSYRRPALLAMSVRSIVQYLTFFPIIVAGPIWRFGEYSLALRGYRAPSKQEIIVGFKRFIFGLAQKLVLADFWGKVVLQVFSQPASSLSWQVAWIGLFAFSLQIYFDFGGYSAMAIGLAAMFGWKLPENFDLPYGASTLQHFWRKWHMSLMNWLKHYVYIPLGGNKRGKIRLYCNVLIVFAVSGLWHGLSGHYLLWGIYHGVCMVAERLFIRKKLQGIAAFFHRIVTLLIVVLGWVWFRCQSCNEAIEYFKALFGFHAVFDWTPTLINVFTYKTYILAGISLFFSVTVISQRKHPLVYKFGIAAAYAAALMQMAQGTFLHYLYAHF